MDATSTKYREASFKGADGVVRSAKQIWPRTDHHYYSFALSRSRFAPVCGEKGRFAAS